MKRIGLSLLLLCCAATSWADDNTCLSQSSSATFAAGQAVPQTCDTHGSTKVLIVDQNGNPTSIGGSLTVTEVDGAPSVTATTLKFPNGTVTDSGSGVATVATAAGTSAGADTAVQTGDGAGGFSDSGCTAATGALSCTSITATGASSGIVQMNGVTNGAFKLTTPDATGQTVTLQPAAQTSGAATFSLQDAAGVNQTIATLAQTQTLTNKTLDCEGTGNACGIKKYKWYPAAGINNATVGTAWDLPTSGAAVPTASTGTNTQKATLDFADGSSLSAQVNDFLNEDWTGAIDATVVWFSSTTSGDVVWQIAIACAGDGESNDPAFTDDVFTADTAKGTGGQYNLTAANTITTTGTCAAGKIMHMRLKRDSAHASDTMAGTGRVLGVALKLREAQ